MDKLSLAALLEEDKEMVMANLARDRSLASAQAVLEKAVDRVMYRYVERCESEALRDGAQNLLQTMKNTLPVMDAVGEARTWKKHVDASERKGLSMGTKTLLILLAGAVLLLASAFAMMFNSRSASPLTPVKALLPVLLGGGCLFWSGTRAARPEKKQQDAPEEAVRTEFLVDAEKAWHCLRGAMLQADGQLERVREDDGLKRQQTAEAIPAGGLSAKELDLFAELLETAGADGSDSGREAASSIRFFLHGAGIDTVDYQPGRESWFEFLPAQRPGTIRPALTSQGKLLKKGMASAKR